MTLQPIPLNFLKYEENFIFFFISVYTMCHHKAVYIKIPVEGTNLPNQ